MDDLHKLVRVHKGMSEALAKHKVALKAGRINEAFDILPEIGKLALQLDRKDIETDTMLRSLNAASLTMGYCFSKNLPKTRTKRSN